MTGGVTGLVTGGWLGVFWLGFGLYKTREIKIINHRNGDLI